MNDTRGLPGQPDEMVKDKGGKQEIGGMLLREQPQQEWIHAENV